MESWIGLTPFHIHIYTHIYLLFKLNFRKEIVFIWNIFSINKNWIFWTEPIVCVFSTSTFPFIFYCVYIYIYIYIYGAGLSVAFIILGILISWVQILVETAYHFTLMSLGKEWIHSPDPNYWWIIRETVVYCTKVSLIYKHVIYVFILRRRRMWSMNTVRESSHISFFCGGDPFLCIRAMAKNHTWHVCLSDQWISPFTWVTSGPLAFAWATSGSLPLLERPADLSPSFERSANLTPSLEWPADLSFAWMTSRSLFLQSKIKDLILSFQIPCGSMNILFASRIFPFMAGHRNLHTSVFFPVICWSYVWTEISLTLSIDNKLYSLPFFFIFSYPWPNLLMLSCDHIEPDKFIHSTLSLAKLVYYKTRVICFS